MAHLQIAILFHGIFELFFYSIAILYFLVFLTIYFGWKRLKEASIDAFMPEFNASVIIAARNEEDTLPLLLNDLENQSYPAELIEVIIVDDHSYLKVKELPAIRNSRIRRLKIIELPEHLTGKKQALIKGASSSSSEVLLFTDADCKVGNNWIKSFMQLYQQKKPDLIIGLVDYSYSHSMVQHFARLEHIALTISGAGSASLGYPTLCNGANLSVKRSLYNDLAEQLKVNIPSGDDMFILHAIKKQKESSVAALYSHPSLVKTPPPSSFRQFMNQRARWTSKSTRYSDHDTLILALTVLLTNLVLISSFTYSACYNGKYSTFVGVYLIKTIADCLITGAGLNYFKGFWQIILMPVFELIYPLYMLATLVKGFTHQYTWKGRSVKSLTQSE